MLKNFDELIQRVKTNVRKRIAVVNAHDEHSLEAIVRAAREGIADPILIGNRSEIERMLRNLTVNETYEIIDVDSTEKAVDTLVRMAREGACDAVMKGHIDTKVMMRAIVNKDNPFNMGQTISSLSLMSVPSYHKLLAITDAGLIPYPTLEQKADQIKSCVAAFHKLGYAKPKVAILCSVDKVNPKMPETVEAEALTKRAAEGEFGECMVYGPLSYDLLISKEAARIKHNESEVCGDADIILVPDINTGNALAKALTYSANAIGGAALLGVKKPVIFSSRASTGEEKYLSIVIASALSE